MKKIFSSQQLQDDFYDNGFVEIGPLDTTDIDKLVSGYNDLRPDDKFDPEVNNVNPYNTSTYHCTFLDTNINYKKQVQALIRKNITHYVEKYLIDYKILQASFYVKPPHKGEFQIHQNWPCLMDDRQTSLTLWIPLISTNEQNATVCFVKGSHKIFNNIESTNVLPFFHNYKKELIDQYLKPHNVQLGKGILFCDSIIHWSPANLSDQSRPAVQITLIPAQEDPIYYYIDKNNISSDVEMYKIDSDFFVVNTLDTAINRPTQYEYLGKIKNPNEEVPFESFKDRLQNHISHRNNFYGL